MALLARNRATVTATGCVATLLAGCQHPPPLDELLRAPGQDVTHVVVTVRGPGLAEPVWRIRSVVTVEGARSESLLPDREPDAPLTLPATYVVRAQGRQGRMDVAVEGLARSGLTAGRGSGSVDLVPGQGVSLTVDLLRACRDEPDCDDGQFCNGPERCVEGFCQAGEVPCPPSLVTCVEVRCQEDAASCLTTARDDACPPQDVGGATESAYCDVAAGCTVGRPGLPRIQSQEVQPPVATRGTVLRLSLTTDEPVPSAPEVFLDTGSERRRWGLVSSDGGVSGRVFSYTYLVDGSEGPGDKAILATLVDMTGDESVDVNVTRVTLDFRGPALQGNPAPDGGVVRRGVTSNLVLEYDEEVVGGPSVQMRPEGAPDGGARAWSCSGDGGTFRCTYQAAGDEEQGAHRVQAEARDRAGNMTVWGTGTLVVDDVAPGFVGSPSVAPAVARVGQVVTVNAQVTEPLAGTPWLEARVDGRVIPLDALQGAPTLWSFYLLVGEGQDGTYGLWLGGMVDVAGNQAPPLQVGVVTLDGLPPQADLTLSSNHLSGQDGFDTLVLDVHANELLRSVDLVFDDAQEPCQATTDLDHTCTRTVVAGGRFGTLPVLAEVRMVDLAGNTGLVARAVVLDFAPPSIVDGSVVTQLVPPVDTEGPVTAVTVGAIVLVSFSVDEDLGTSPEVRLGGISMARGEARRRFYSFKHRLAAGDLGDGLAGLEVTLEDVVGNRATVLPVVGGEPVRVPVDTTPPLPPATDQPRAVVYERVPWGTTESGGLPRFKVRGGPGAVELSSTVLVMDREDGEQVLAREPVMEDGSFDVVLNTGDRAEVYLEVVDGAGNRSHRVRVKDQDWVVSLTGKVPGSTVENPHVLSTTPALTPSLVQPPGMTDEVTLAGATATARRRWLELERPAMKPSGRREATLVHDSMRGRTYLWGGACWGGITCSTEVYEWHAPSWTWTRATVRGLGPVNRTQHAAVFDAARGVVVLFGGSDSVGSDVMDDTWEWNPDTGVWTERSTDSRPPARCRHAMAYDPARRVVVMLGGWTQSRDGRWIPGTWEWWPEEGRWVEWPAVTGADPGELAPGAMAFHPQDGRVVACSATGTWAWEGGGRWSPVGGVPSSGAPLFLAARTATGTVLATDPGVSPDVWEWDGQWTLLDDDSGDFWLTGGATATLDATRDELVVFGGYSGTWDPVTQVWTGGPGWLDATPPDTPSLPVTVRGAAAHDRDHDVIVVAGGRQGILIQTFNATTWEWSSKTNRSEAFPSAGLEGLLSLAYDESQGKVMAWRPSTGTLHAWEHNPTRWVGVTPVGSGPDPRPEPADQEGLAWDGVGLVLCGKGETWTWDGATRTWTPHHGNPAPPVLTNPRATYDRKGNRVFLMGNNNADLWAWDGTTRTWSKVSSNRPVLYGSAVAVDPDRGVLHVLGGTNGSDVVGDHWTWSDALGWTPFPPLFPQPIRRTAALLLADEHRGTLVLMAGGNLEDGSLSDVWELTGGVGDQPAVLVDVSWGAARLPGAVLTGLRVWAHVGGTVSSADGDPLPGAALLAWTSSRGGGWTTLATNSAPVEALEPLQVNSVPGETLGSLLVGDSHLGLHFAFVPRHHDVQDGGPEQVTLQAVDVTVEVHVP